MPRLLTCMLLVVMSSSAMGATVELLVAPAGGRFARYDPATGNLLGVGKTLLIDEMQFGPDGYIYNTRIDSLVRRDPITGKVLASIPLGVGTSLNSHGLAFSSDGQRFYTSDNSTIYEFDFATFSLRRQFDASVPRYLVYGPDGLLYATEPHRIGRYTVERSSVHYDHRSGTYEDPWDFDFAPHDGDLVVVNARSDAPDTAGGVILDKSLFPDWRPDANHPQIRDIAFGPHDGDLYLLFSGYKHGVARFDGQTYDYKGLVLELPRGAGPAQTMLFTTVIPLPSAAWAGLALFGLIAATRMLARRRVATGS